MLLLSSAIVAASSSVRAQGDSWSGPDKALHFAAGSGLAAGGYALGALVADEPRDRVLWGLGVALGGGATKELVDRRSGGDPSWRDFTWTAVGAATGATIMWAIDRARRRRQPSRAPGARAVGSRVTATSGGAPSAPLTR